MSTSIITTTTFTIATVIDVRPPLAPTSPAPVAAAPEMNEPDIEACLLNAFPRCGWTERKRCGRRNVCQS